jgi:hypothetical protein
MIVALIFSFLSVLSAILESRYNFKYGLKCSILLIFIFLGFRGDYGNDYFAYFEAFQQLNDPNIFSSDLDFKGIEIGWSLLNLVFSKLFGDLGFFVLTFFLSAFTSIVLYRFVLKFVPKEYYWFAIFYYVFNFEIMLVQCSAFRQSIAISIFLISFEYLVNRQFLKYSLLVLLSVSFHTSSLFLLLIYFLGSKRIKLVFILLPLFILILLFSIYYDTIVSQFSFFQIYSELYQIYEGEEYSDRSFGVGFIFNLTILLTLFFLLIKEKLADLNLLISIVLISILIIPLSIYNPMIVRLNFYLLPLMMFLLPLSFKLFSNSIIKISFTTLIVLFTLYSFFKAHFSPIYMNHYMDYKTFFESKIFWNSVFY